MLSRCFFAFWLFSVGAGAFVIGLSHISSFFLATELDIHRIMSGFHGAFARGVAPSRDRLPFRTPGTVYVLGNCLCSNLWDQIALSLLDFSPWIPLGTFSILLSLLSKFVKWKWKSSRVDVIVKHHPFCRCRHLCSAFLLCVWTFLHRDIYMVIRYFVCSSLHFLSKWLLHNRSGCRSTSYL